MPLSNRSSWAHSKTETEMNKTLVTIVALSVDTRHATLYLSSGETMNIPQGDARLPRILEQSKKELEAGYPVTVDVTPIFVQRTEFADAEKGTKGVIKFLRVAKSFLKSLVNTESPKEVDESAAHVSPLTIGVFPGQASNQVTKEDNECVHDYVREDTVCTECGEDAQTPAVDGERPDPAEKQEQAAAIERDASKQDATNRQSAEPLTNDQKLDAARARMQQLVGNSVGTERAEFHAPLNEKEETIVAVHEKTGAIIPDAHKLARQLRSAQKLQDYAGFEKFIERLSSIIDQRGHSVEDLMKFIELGDLPIADDGCIVIYKRLESRGSGVFVDVHSKLIKQKVGSYVFMRAGLVDPNRRQDCSNGLHVASLSYIKGFSGNVTVMAKVRPEDVFAVPEYSHNKMRVCGYHILAELPEKLRNLVNGGGSISSDPDGARLLANVLRGNHVAITQHVEVGGHKGTNVSYTDVQVKSADQLQSSEARFLNQASTLDMTEVLQAKAPVAPEIKAKDLVQKPDNSADAEKVIISFMSNSPSDTKETSKSEAVVEAAPVTEPGKKMGPSEKADKFHFALLNAKTPKERSEAALGLRDLKKQARKSWTALGMPESLAGQIAKILDEKPQDKAVKQARPAKEAKETKPAKTEKPASKVLEENKFEVAKRLIKDGQSNVEVASKTGLSKDQVYRLKKKLSLS